MSPFDPARKKFLDVTNYYGQMAEMDAQGRLLIAATAAGVGEGDGRRECAGRPDDVGSGEGGVVQGGGEGRKRALS